MSNFTRLLCCLTWGLIILPQFLFAQTWQVQSDYFGERNTNASPRTIRSMALSQDGTAVYTGNIQSPNAGTTSLRKVSATVLATSGTDHVIFGNGMPGGTGDFAPVGGQPVYAGGATGTFLGWRDTGNSPEGIATDDRGYVYVALNSGISSANRVDIFSSDLSTTIGSITVTGPVGVAVRKLGTTYYAYIAAGGQVRRWDVTTAATPTQDASWTPPATAGAEGLEVDTDGTVFVAGGGLVRRISADGTAITHTYTLANAADVAIFRNKIYVIRMVNPAPSIVVLNKIDLTSGGADITVPELGVFTRGALSQFTAIDVSADGKLFVSEENYTAGSNGIPSYTPPVTSFNPTPGAITGRIYFDRVLISSTVEPTLITVNVTQPTCELQSGTIVITATGDGVLEYSIDNGMTWSTMNTFSGLSPSSSHTVLVRSQSVPSGITAYGSNPVSINAVPGFPTITNTNTGEQFCTIQAAIDDAQTLNGHTITIAAGTYNESININKSLIIKGAQADVCAATTRPGAESIINCVNGIGITADNVIINGFTIQGQTTNAGPGFGYAVYMAPPRAGTQLLNNIIKNNRVGSSLANTGASQAIIKCNWFDANNNAGAASGNGIYTDEYTGGGVISNVLIENNKFSGNASAGITISTSQAALATTGITITKNEFSGNARAAFLYNTVSSSFTNNVISGSTRTDGTGDLRIFGGVNNLSVMNNSFSAGGPRGILITNDGTQVPATNSNITITQNSFTGYTSTNFAIANVSGYTGAVPATCNWYGGTGASVPPLISGSVTFEPFLTNGTDNDAAIGFQPVPNSCTGCASFSPTITVTETSGTTNNDGTICNGASVTLTSSVGVSYVWNTGPMTQGITVSPTTTTPYSVTVTDANGCVAVASTTVTVNTVTAGSLSSNVASICQGGSVDISHTGNTGTGAFVVFQNGTVLASFATSEQVEAFFPTATPGQYCVYSFAYLETPSCGNFAGFTLAQVINNCFGQKCYDVSDPLCITVTANNTVGSASSSPTLCINTLLTSITHSTTGATGIGTATGLPMGVTAAWAANTITISGTPTQSGIFNYSIPLTGGCGSVNATGMLTVTANNTVGSASSSPTLCINTLLTSITHSTTGATGIGTATGLPMGVTAAWAANTITISGTPTQSGIFNYSIPLTGGCGSVNATGMLTVTANNTVGSASSSPTLCINTLLTSITHSTTGATGIGTATGLPMGVTAAWAANTITISGTPTQSGIFNYSIPLTGGCGSVNATGMLTVTANNTVGSASSSPTLCINTLLTSITHSTTGATGIGTATGLPMGVTAAWAANTITISGTPTQSGIFNYSIPLTGGCGSVNATGMLTVTANNTVGSASSSPTLCINTLLTSITHSTTGATGIGTATGLPMGVTAAWAANTITISGTPTQSGIFNYSIPLTGGCGSVNATGTLTVNPLPTASISAIPTAVCQNAPFPSVTFTGSGGTAPYTFTYQINGGSEQTITTSSGNSVSVSQSTAMAEIFLYTLVSVKDASSTQCTQPITGQTATITVNAPPTLGSTPASLCTGQSFTLSPIVGGTWISSNPSLATVNLPTAGVVQGLAPGSVYFTFTETLTGCSSKTADVLIKQTPSSALTASKYDVCANTEVTLNPNCSIPTSTLQWNPGAPTVTPAAATLPYVYRARCVADGCVGNETSVEVRTHRILVDMKDLDVGSLPLPIVRSVKDNMAPTNLIQAPVFPRRWTFIANGCDASESAEFKLSGPVLFNAIDNTSTYAMFANEGNTFYSIDHPNYGNGGSFPDGEYSLTVNLRSKDGVGGPYPKNRVPVGALLATRTLKFTVGNPVGLRQGVESIGSELSEANWVMVVQNPVSEEVMVRLSGKVGEEVGLSLVNLQGQSIQQRSVKLSTVDQAEVLNIRNAPSGLYILKAIKGDKVKTIKVVKVD